MEKAYNIDMYRMETKEKRRKRSGRRENNFKPTSSCMLGWNRKRDSKNGNRCIVGGKGRKNDKDYNRFMLKGTLFKNTSTWGNVGDRWIKRKKYKVKNAKSPILFGLLVVATRKYESYYYSSC